jgi:hypothetical protein
MRVLTESERNKILKHHNFLPGRRAKLVSTEVTKDNGWCQRACKHLIGKEGIIIQVHENVKEAVQVELILENDKDIRYWHYKDLELIMQEDVSEIKPVFFDLSTLDYC